MARVIVIGAGTAPTTTTACATRWGRVLSTHALPDDDAAPMLRSKRPPGFIIIFEATSIE